MCEAGSINNLNGIGQWGFWAGEAPSQKDLKECEARAKRLLDED